MGIEHEAMDADAPGAAEPAATTDTPVPGTNAQTEVGGRQGPDPTRYGDWEKLGRCIDF